MQKILEGKNIIITGTSRGMGRAMLEVFAENGANIWAHARVYTNEFEELCKSIEQKHRVEIHPLCFDLTDYGAMKNAIKSIMITKIPVDALINNAGITYNALFQMSSLDEVRRQMEVNYFAPYALSQYVSKLMLKNKKGSIVNITSTAAMDGNLGKTAYGASKAALIAMTKSIAAEMGKDGIRANCIAPGITDTDMLLTMPEHVVEETISSVALRRAGLPVDIAHVAAFLASDCSSYITGQTIRVDGGM